MKLKIKLIEESCMFSFHQTNFFTKVFYEKKIDFYFEGFIKSLPLKILLEIRLINFNLKAKKLVFQIKKCFKDPNYPILIDEEGGRVSRLKRIIDTSLFTSQYFSKIYQNNKKKFFLYYGLYVNSISSILNSIGININIVPVLDIRRKITSKITPT